MSRLRRSISRAARWRIAGTLCASLCTSALSGASEEEPGKILEAIEHHVRDVFARCRDAIVKIEAVDAHGRLSGTGFFIDPNGTLYTSYTVGGDTRDIVVTYQDQRFPATRVVSDLRSGMAILKIDAETPFLTFGKSTSLEVASPVIAIGYPMDLPLTPTFGTVGGFDRKYLGRYFATTHIRANVCAQRGEGGAPLLNNAGAVVGILISRLDSGSAAFVLPIEAAEKVRMDFMRFREVRPGWLGVQVRTVRDAAGASSAEVEEVIADAPAQNAGMKVGDVFLQVAGRKVVSPEDLLDASFFLTAEDIVPVRIARGGEELELAIRPSDPPNTTRAGLPALGSASELPLPAWKLGH